MKKENKLIRLRCIWLSKCVIISSIIVFSTSCEKEDESTKQVCSFQDYFYKGDMECYDSAGVKYDSLTYMHTQDDFVFPEAFEQPYSKIEINEDHTAVMYYTLDDSTYIRNEWVTEVYDTLYFYEESNLRNTLIKGVIVDHQLRLPGYGCIYYVLTSDGLNQAEFKKTTIGLGTPALKDLLKEFPYVHFFEHEVKRTQKMYFQRFELVYDITSE